jgi:hypothetical protein
VDSDGIIMRARVTLAAGLVLLVLAIVFVLTRSPPTLVGDNGVPLEGTFAHLPSGSSACQAHTPLLAGASAVRVSLYAGIGPRVSVRVLSSDGRLLASGVRGSGWRGESPTVALAAPSSAAANTNFCFALGSSGESVGLDGSGAQTGEGARTRDGSALGVRLRIEYLRPGARTWLALVPSVARRVGLGRWAAGTWVALLLALLAGTLLVGAAWTTARELR